MRTSHKALLIGAAALGLYGVLAWYLPARQRRVELTGVEQRLADVEATLDRLLDHLRAAEAGGGAVAVPAGFRRVGEATPDEGQDPVRPSGLLVGRTHAEVLERLGPPDMAEGERWSYPLGEGAGRLELTFRAGCVREVQVTLE